jgi:hypothetical protein
MARRERKRDLHSVPRRKARARAQDEALARVVERSEELAQEARPDDGSLQSHDRHRHGPYGQRPYPNRVEPPVADLAARASGKHAFRSRDGLDAELLGDVAGQREQLAARVDSSLHRPTVYPDLDARKLPCRRLGERRDHLGLTAPLDPVRLLVPERLHQLPEGEVDLRAETGEELVGGRQSVRLEVDERERDLGVDAEVDLPARIVHDATQQQLRRLVVAEEVFELCQSSHRFERSVAACDDGSGQLPCPHEVAGRVRSHGLLGPRVDLPPEDPQPEVESSARASSRSASWASIQRPMSCSRTWATIASRRRRRSAASISTAVWIASA